MCSGSTNHSMVARRGRCKGFWIELRAAFDLRLQGDRNPSSRLVLGCPIEAGTTHQTAEHETDD